LRTVDAHRPDPKTPSTAPTRLEAPRRRGGPATAKEKVRRQTWRPAPPVDFQINDIRYTEQYRRAVDAAAIAKGESRTV
jgi:hypothetical protein